MLEKYYLIQHELKRKEIWINAWCSVANALNCRKPEDATRWADKALKDFDERFKKDDKK